MKYFDLNERVQKGLKNNGGVVLEKDPGLTDLSRKSEIPVLSFPHQLLMYLGTFLGIVFSTAISQFRSGSVHVELPIGEIILSAVIAVVIIPLVYEKLMLNPRAPLIVQFGIFVQNGVFWHVLIDSIGSLL
jgi:cytochrome c oxidase assembly factor CtaG